MIRSFLTMLLLFAGSASCWSDVWLEDFEAAKKAAAATGKPILVDVTGSDWCPPCQLMESEVFGRADFVAQAQARYVLLRLDFPRNTAQSEKLKAQNKALADRYPFEGFPTYFLMDEKGLVYGQKTGYLAGGVAAFFKMTRQLEAQKDTLKGLLDALAKAPAGADRAKAQDALYRQAEAWELTAQYADLPLRIVQEDKDGKAGLKPRYQVLNTYNRMLATWSEGSDFRKAAADLEALAARSDAWPDLKQRILFTEGMVWLNAVSDELKAKDALTRARAIDSGSAQGRRASELLDQLP